MRGHALVLLVVLALVVPATPGVGAQSADAIWEQAHQLVRRGDDVGAEQLYATTAAQFGDPIASRALLLEARAALADNDTDTAEAVLQQLLDQYPSSEQVPGAYFSLAQVRRAAGDCAGALRALDAFEAIAGRTAIGPYAALQRAECDSRLGDWSDEVTAAQAALSIEGGGPRLTQIEALERAAEGELKLGRTQAALDFYNRSLALAATPAYTAEMLFTTATLARGLGQDALATDRFRAVVVDYATQARAPAALDALDDMNLATSVSPLQAGTVRLNSHADNQSAVDLFDQVDPSSPDWGPAQLGRAEALLQLNDVDGARQGLEAVSAGADAPSAGRALFRLAQLDERAGDETSAEADYARMARAAPDRSAEAQFHIGFTRFVRGDQAGALSAWQTGLASGPPSPAMQSQLEYWLAKVLPAGSAAAQDALHQAATAAPETYYGLRALELLSPTLSVASSAPSTSAAWLAPSAQENQEHATWLAGLNTTPDQVAQDINGLPALLRADALLELGLQTEAGWEVDGVQQQYAQAQDIAHLSGLADWATERDQPQWTLRIGKQMRDLVGLSNLPRAAQKQVFPAGWGDLVAAQAAQYGVDPLLILALVRQESSFDPHAQSGAQAMGLTQIVPGTARTIAGRLGDPDFATADLLKPDTSIQFGTWFMSQLLGQYKNRTFPALAAYDAGPGNVTTWLREFGDDPDLLVEQIPFTETQNYLRIVYDNYWHYQEIWLDGSRP